MAELKTKATSDSVTAFIASLDDAQQQADSTRLVELMQSVTKEEPVMWGGSIIGFGRRQLKYASGRELDWMRIGFSPRKGKLTIYATMDAQQLTAQFSKLGSYTIGKGCIYIKRLADVEEMELKKLFQAALTEDQ